MKEVNGFMEDTRRTRLTEGERILEDAVKWL